MSNKNNGVQTDLNNEDSITVQDRSGRRQFFRQGAAYMSAAGIVGGLMSASGNAYADDCDRNARSEKNAQAPNTDSDAGASADPEACGREPEKPKLSQAPNTLGTGERTGVVKIKG